MSHLRTSSSIGSGTGNSKSETVRPKLLQLPIALRSKARRSLAILAAVLIALVGLASNPVEAAMPEPEGGWSLGDRWWISPVPEWDTGDHVIVGLPGNHIHPNFMAAYITYHVPSADGAPGSPYYNYPSSSPDSDFTTKISVSATGLPSTVYPELSGGIALRCTSFEVSECQVPPGGFSVTLSWTDGVYDGSCIDENRWDNGRANTDKCDPIIVHGSATRTFVPYGTPPPATESLSASFSYEVTNPATREVTFTDQTTGGSSNLSYEWDFGDGNSSHAKNPVHTYQRNGSFTVELTVTDNQTDEESSSSQTISFESGLIVNSTSDLAATNPSTTGCDTGNLVDDEPECTLRAALQTAEVRGGGTITFDIPSESIPTITTQAPLPTISTDLNLDGTSQSGGWVAVNGSGDFTFEIVGGTVAMSGLATANTASAVMLRGGSGHQITGNRLGTNPTGTERNAPGSDYAVLSNAPGTVVSNNVMAGDAGVFLGSEADGSTITNNHLGTTTTSAPIGNMAAGLLVKAPNTTVQGNEIAASDIGVLVDGPSATGAHVSGNFIGVNKAGTALGTTGEGVRINGSPNATVSNNLIVTTNDAAVVVSGSDQSEAEAETDKIILLTDWEYPAVRPVTGGTVEVSDNTLTSSKVGVVTFAGASGVTVLGNIIKNASEHGVLVIEGANHEVLDNTIGSDSNYPEEGVSVLTANSVTVGSADEPNTIFAKDSGVFFRGGSGHKINGNIIGSPSARPDTAIEVHTVENVAIGQAGAGNNLYGKSVGIDVKNSSKNTTVSSNTINTDNGVGVGIGADTQVASVADNTVTGSSVGIVSVIDGTQISGNTVTEPSSTGVMVGGTNSKISRNTIWGSGQYAILSSGEGATIEFNWVGLGTSESDVRGNAGVGIKVADGTALLERNIVAESGGNGIDVAAVASAQLKSNRIWDSGVKAITAGHAPPAPTIAAAIRHPLGSNPRVDLVVTGLPMNGGGRVEVFANNSCDKPEARFLVGAERVTNPDRTYRVVTLRGEPAERDHFTVTYTSHDGVTSELSGCESIGSYPDDDQDGAPDAVEELIPGASDNPRHTVVITDNETLLSVLGAAVNDEGAPLERGRFEQVMVQPDPTPDSHPAGWDLVYGAITFRLVDLNPGDLAMVVLVPHDGEEVSLDQQYWKYGPQSMGATPSWYEFTLDGESGTGADLATRDVLGALRRVWVLYLIDGGRGDNDGSANGVIHDPGGPVVISQTPPGNPPGGDSSPTGPVIQPPPRPETTDEGDGSTPKEDSGSTPDSDASVSEVLNENISDRHDQVANRSTLPRTGSRHTMALAYIGFVLIPGGIALLVGRRQLLNKQRLPE